MWENVIKTWNALDSRIKIVIVIVAGFAILSCNLWIAIAISASTVGCQSLKESTVVATGSAIGAGVGTVISSGVGAPILGAMTGAFVTDVATEVLTTGQETQTIIKAPDNFFYFAS